MEAVSLIRVIYFSSDETVLASMEHRLMKIPASMELTRMRVVIAFYKRTRMMRQLVVAAMSNVQVNIIKFENLGDMPFPSYATAGSAGMDLIAALWPGETRTLKPMQRTLIDTGIAIALPEGYEAQVKPRSGLALAYGITVLNAPGTIDYESRGEIGVLLFNCGNQDFTIERGMRIAQLVVAKYEKVDWNVVIDLSSTERGAGGFGSTGRHKKSSGQSSHSCVCCNQRWMC
jgi:dUTP pyrophosphatase